MTTGDTGGEVALIATLGPDNAVIVNGELDMATAGTASISLVIEQAVAMDPDGVVTLDLAGVSFIDAKGLGSLIRIRHEYGADKGREVVLQNPSERVSNILKLTQTADLFSVRITE